MVEANALRQNQSPERSDGPAVRRGRLPISRQPLT